MPKIVQYVAPSTLPTESTRGAAAFEQAGRRLGPLYNEAATFQKEAGKADAQAIKNADWPAGVAKLLAAEQQGGYNFRVTNPRDTGPTGGSFEDNADGYAATSQIAKGAAALGRSLSDGGRAIASKAKTPEAYTLVNGQLVTASAADKKTSEYNANVQADAQTYGDAVHDYWSRYYGGQSQVDQTIPINKATGVADPNYYQTSQSGQNSDGWFSGLSDTISNAASAVGDYATTGNAATTDTGL